ncbi:hypothetical protein L596_026572 [Steinernema carpocapsae]|uniref:Uncharacterized protein n=1 Tax=Steinernema carpocapsae TaxID=34508 RepID=A0A4U5M1S4_STECR|nr:hypothetical protein L596_026572 [Steinernema carpocapsae]
MSSENDFSSASAIPGDEDFQNQSMGWEASRPDLWNNVLPGRLTFVGDPQNGLFDFGDDVYRNSLQDLAQNATTFGVSPDPDDYLTSRFSFAPDLTPIKEEEEIKSRASVERAACKKLDLTLDVTQEPTVFVKNNEDFTTLANVTLDVTQEATAFAKNSEAFTTPKRTATFATNSTQEVTPFRNAFSKVLVTPKKTGHLTLNATKDMTTFNTHHRPEQLLDIEDFDSSDSQNFAPETHEKASNVTLDVTQEMITVSKKFQAKKVAEMTLDATHGVTTFSASGGQKAVLGLTPSKDSVEPMILGTPVKDSAEVPIRRVLVTPPTDDFSNTAEWAALAYKLFTPNTAASMSPSYRKYMPPGLVPNPEPNFLNMADVISPINPVTPLGSPEPLTEVAKESGDVPSPPPRTDSSTAGMDFFATSTPRASRVNSEMLFTKDPHGMAFKESLPDALKSCVISTDKQNSEMPVNTSATQHNVSQSFSVQNASLDITRKENLDEKTAMDERLNRMVTFSHKKKKTSTSFKFRVCHKDGPDQKLGFRLIFEDQELTSVYINGRQMRFMA